MLLQRIAKRLRPNRPRLAIHFVKQSPSWLSSNLAAGASPPPPRLNGLIEKQVAMTQQLGERPLWSGYAAAKDYPRSTTGSRTVADVRTDAVTGAFYVWLVRALSPETVVEFGAAFGVSGMYWLAGLEEAQRGRLYSFEPNADWADLARTNMSAISNRFTLSVGTFEEHAASALGSARAQLAFIDAIHTSEFVNAQFAILKRYMKPGGVVLFDDIDFSEDMQQCWKAIATSIDIKASATLGRRVGIVELS